MGNELAEFRVLRSESVQSLDVGGLQFSETPVPSLYGLPMYFALFCPFRDRAAVRLPQIRDDLLFPESTFSN
ncbi:MAG: hypothetical protein A3H27_05455 [Acidobacteria bacterium RIFCSPLOWO2_02_FULL_59_13]|nr:MAG: hypothetical protein A3H27_05455 [Acidobacteria bacterium RIFCSPLOWO2_02_FULL_59_13]